MWTRKSVRQLKAKNDSNNNNNTNKYCNQMAARSVSLPRKAARKLQESRFFDDSQDPYISLPSPPSPIPRTRENMLRRLAANKSVRASRGEGPQVLMKYFEIRQPMDNGKAFGAEVAPTLGHGAWAKSRYKPTMLRPDWSCGPTTNGEMVSRRKILSRSRDDLNLDVPAEHPEEEDVWYQKEKLFKDHIQEVLNKWESIDDEIWAKIIVLERNRRVAKAYARAPVLTVNGSDDGFDGFRIGLSGFENPMRDPKTDEVKRHIGQGCKIKMDDSGNILIKRIAKSNVYIKSTLNTPEDTAIANDILKLPNGGLEAEKPVKLFDMKKFQQNVSRELKRGYPDRRKLECQCISAVAFVKNEADILEAPCWIMLINVVAMDMLKSKMPPDIRNRPRIPIPDEDPYSIAGSGSSGSSGNGNRERSRDKPPKLPPRDNNAIYGTTGMPRPDYEHMVDEHRFRQQLEARNKAPKKGEKRSDDPYYCGLRARIPNFAKTKAQRDKEAANSIYARLPTHAQPQAHPGYGHIGMYGPARGFLDNDYESDYSHIYGRLPLPTRFRHAHGPPGRQMYVSEWE